MNMDKHKTISVGRYYPPISEGVTVIYAPKDGIKQVLNLNKQETWALFTGIYGYLSYHQKEDLDAWFNTLQEESYDS
jgi:hypothetical protein